MSKERIKNIRSRIDSIDDQMLSLLNERGSLAKEIGEVKQDMKETGQKATYHPDRESMVSARLRSMNEGPLTDDQVEQLFTEIKSCCLSLQKSLSIAYLGPRGTYSEAAAIKQFGHFQVMKSQASIEDVFHQVNDRHCDYGVVPIENNSVEGIVYGTLDCLIDFDLRICAELRLPIHHAFLAKRDTNPESIRRIYSHEQTLAQCRRWLRANYRYVEQVVVASNAVAAKLACIEDNAAAIAGTMAAEMYELDVLQQNIEDGIYNSTRFLVIGTHEVGPTGTDKTSLLVMANDEQTINVKHLKPLENFSMQLCHMDIRDCSSSKWSDAILLDVEGHETSESIQSAMSQFRDLSMDVRCLGSYPRVPRL